MNLSEIKSRLLELDVVPSKSMGQNFLHDENSAGWIVEQLNLSADDCVVEVGPGTGAMTEHIAGRCRKLILIEFDRRLAAGLKQKYAERDDVVVYHVDAVQFDVRLLYKERPVKFVGNLPYSCGGEIMRNFLSSPSPVTRAVVMLQHEVIERLAATPGNKIYGVFTLRTQAFWEVKSMKKLGPDLFYPRPKIDSSVALLTRKDMATGPTFSHPLFDRMIRHGFSQRRKQVKGLLPELPRGRSWQELVEKIAAAPTVRAEELSLDQWIAITNAYDDHPLAGHAQKDSESFDVVDENDVVVRQETRGDVHANGWIHRAVHLFMFDKRGNLLLQKRSHLKDKHPGVWDSSAAGHLDAGECYRNAAERELEEELGFEEGKLVEVCKIPPTEATGWEFITLFAGRYAGKPVWPASEIETVLAFSLEEIRQWVDRVPEDFASGFIACLRAFDEANAS